MADSTNIATPFSHNAWLAPWARTAAVGTVILFVVFVGYEVIERAWLRDLLPTDELFTLHILRGAGSSVILGTWTFYNVWRMSRLYDETFARAYRRVERTAEERTADLVRAQRFNERLFDAIRDRLLVLDEAGAVRKANRVVVEGDPAAAGATPIEKEVAERAVRGRAPVTGEVETDAASGRIFAVDAYPLPEGDGALAIVLARDVTRAKQLEAQLRNQEKLAALGQLASGIAHDIANPLASMSSELEMLELETDLARVRESLGTLGQHVRRIERTLRDMTDFARRRGDEAGEVSVAVAVEDALRMVRHDPRARRVRITTDVPRGLEAVRMVEDHLVMVLVNLLLNAFDAMPGGGDLTLRAERVAPGRVRVAVADTGVGMTEEVLRRCTEPLFTTKPGGHGTGLGLSISSDVLRAAGGSLDIDSKPGLGTTVYLTCPTVAHA